MRRRCSHFVPSRAAAARQRWLVGACAVLGACGGSSGSGAPGTSDAKSDASVLDSSFVQDDASQTAASSDGGSSDAGASGCDAFLNAFCIQTEKCETAGFRQDWYGTVPKCVEQLQPSCAAELAAPGTATTEQTMNACAKALMLQSCAGFLTAPPAACLTPGTLANGAACEFPTQCASTYCAASGFCGTCQPRVAAGAQCVPVADPRYVACESGLVCEYSGSSSKCSTPLQAGATCDSSFMHQCTPPLTCLQGLCSPALAIDAGPCNLDSDCAGGAYCSVAFQATMCRMPTYQPPGAPCNFQQGMPCGAGASCLAGDAAATTGNCVAVAANGGPCGSDSDCPVPGLCTSGACQLAVPASSCH